MKTALEILKENLEAKIIACEKKIQVSPPYEKPNIYAKKLTYQNVIEEIVKLLPTDESQTEALKKEIEELKKKVESLQYSEAMAGVHIYNLECERSLYMSIAEALTDELKNDIDGVMDSCNINGEVEIVKEEDVPTDNIQNEDWGIFKDIRIDQWGVGDSGDSFEGLIYARIDHKEKKTWLKIPYNC